MAEIQTGNNFLGYEFPCGCRMPASYGAECAEERITITCPTHGCKWSNKVMICFECLRIFKNVSRRAIPRCDTCRADHRRDRIRISQRERKKNGKVYKTKVSEKKKPTIDQTKRWECVRGDNCLNGEVFRNEKFNCHSCKRFEKKVMLDTTVYSKENMEYIYA